MSRFDVQRGQRIARVLAIMLILLSTLPALPGHAQEVVPSQDPLSSLVAVTYVGDEEGSADNAADFVKGLVTAYATGALNDNTQFPLPTASTDSVRAIAGFQPNVVVSWLDPLTWDATPDAPRFGANADYTAYFGDGWGDADGMSPYYKGSDHAGWVWINHEYVSGNMPSLTSAPDAQHMTLARFLQNIGVLSNDVTAQEWSQEEINTYVDWYKKQMGGSWLRVVQDPATGAWAVDRSADNKRYDSSASTLTSVTGQTLSAQAQISDTGVLPIGVVPGIMGDCSGAQTPWGTVITAEENVQDYFGDLEACWSSNQAFVPESGFDPGSTIAPLFAPSEGSEFGRSTAPFATFPRDYYGYLVEMHPGADPADYYESVATGGDGAGHRKIGAAGRARWENAAFAVGSNWELTPGQPLVMYGGDDRRSGRIFKLVSKDAYTEGMSEAEVRALLDDGTLYVAHFAGLDFDTGYTVNGELPTEATPGQGRWIELSTTSTDLAPNAEALGNPEMTVGQALQDVNWNDIGGFATDNDVRMALFTAANKIGVAELNRPEDIEWNPVDPSGAPRLYVAFTNHNRQVALDENGVLYDPATHADQSPKRADTVGSVFAMQEADPSNPGAAREFTYWAAWRGTNGAGAFDAANPDNLMIDRDGGVWFGTDGNFGTNGTADSLYYLDLDPAHKEGVEGVVTATYGLPFRVISGPSDAEATGPAFSAGMGTIFFNVQHPGESIFSSWPQGR